MDELGLGVGGRLREDSRESPAKQIEESNCEIRENNQIAKYKRNVQPLENHLGFCRNGEEAAERRMENG